MQHQHSSTAKIFDSGRTDNVINEAVLGQCIGHYIRIHRRMKIPMIFRIPEYHSSGRWPKEFAGIELGQELYRVKKLLEQENAPSLSPEFRSKLDQIQLGRLPRGYLTSFLGLATAKAYVEVHGDLNVPFNFIVPTNALFPVYSWGRNFGQQLVYLRKQGETLPPSVHHELSKLGMRWSASPHPQKTNRKTHVDALVHYSNLHGHMRIPLDFVVPKVDTKDWPEEFHGLKLGILAEKQRNTRRHLLTQDQIERLSKAGYIWDTVDHRFREVLLPALRVYLGEFGNLLIPKSFQVPARGPWPEAAWNVRLGRRVRRLRMNRIQIPAKYHQALVELGIVKEHDSDSEDASDLLTEHRFWVLKLEQETLPLFQQYRKLIGHGYIPNDFVIPNESRDWPAGYWNYPLGNRAKALRHMYNHKREMLPPTLEAALNALDFIWNGTEFNQRCRAQQLVLAMQTYGQQYGHVVIPDDYVVTEEDDDGFWPAELRGFKLGASLRYYRCCFDPQEIDPSLRRAFDELGYVLCDPKYSALYQLQILPSLRLFKEQYGDLAIPKRFVIPEAEDDVASHWPEALMGFDLGLKVYYIRHGQIRLPEAYRLALDELGFIWQTGEAYKLVRFQHEMIPVLQLYQKLVGKIDEMPRNFIVPETEPWPLKCWNNTRALGKQLYRLQAQSDQVAPEIKAMLAEINVFLEK